MLYIEKITDHRIGNRTPFKDVAESLGWTITLNEDQVEKAYDGSLWEKGYAPTQSLDELKEIKLKELSTIADSFEQNLNKDMYFTSSLGFRCNGDRRTKDNLQDLIKFFDVNVLSSGDPKTIQYRDYDNLEHNLTKEQLQTLLSEHVTNGQNLYTQKWNFENQIKNSESLDQLNNIDIKFGMMDFSSSTTA